MLGLKLSIAPPKLLDFGPMKSMPISLGEPGMSLDLLPSLDEVLGLPNPLEQIIKSLGLEIPGLPKPVFK